MVFLHESLMKARFPQVLQDDIPPLDVVKLVFRMVWCTELTISEAFVGFIVIRASWAAPSDVARVEVHVALQLVSILVKLFNEGQRLLIV